MISSTQPLGTPGEQNLRDRNASVTPYPKGDNPSGSPGPTVAKSVAPESAKVHINPSVEDTNITPGTDSEK